jgi:micrococcal nuclease
MKKTFRYTLALFLIIIILSPFISHAQSSIQGKVVSVADGDTITVLQNSKQYKIRLYGIDTPEKKQDFGQKAKQFTSSMVFKQHVKVVVYDTDRYGRTVGVVYIGQKCLNEEIIKNGLAWVYKRYCSESFCNHWLKLEQDARVNKLGLWTYYNPIPPWDFRRGKSNKSKDKIPGEYHGNVSSKVFHESDCKYFDCKKCTKIFQDREAAIKSGYRPCGICKP